LAAGTAKSYIRTPMKSILIFLSFGICWHLSTAQISALSTAPEKTETRSGNKQFNKGNYTDAEASYKKALDKKNNMPEATFNLGDAVYQQKRYDEAAKQFQLSGQTNTDKTIKAKAYHNLGNTFLEQEKWQDAVKAYKEALKQNPQDIDTKYNLAYANAKLKQQQQDGGQDNKDNKDNKDKKDDKKDQQNKDQQDKKDQEQKQDQQQADNQDKKEQQKQQGQQPKLSKEEAEKILQAMQNEEQKTNQKVQQKQMRMVPIKIDKDW
jgi:tetratricopeptide (TPR) repeat protein